MMASSTEPLFLGLDIGTLDLRAVLVTAGGRVVVERIWSLQVDVPVPGHAEHDPERDWWAIATGLIKQVLAEAQVPRSVVAGVGVCGLFPVVCLLDAAGKPLGNAWLYSDQRAADWVTTATAAVGRPLIGDEVLPKLLWLKDTAPEQLAQVGSVLSAAGYLVYRLTGRAVIDPHNAYRFGLAEAGGLGWRADVLAALGLPAHVLPPIARFTEVAGGLSAMAAAQTGLALGTPVVVGATDTLATLLGHGVIEPGDAMLYYGSTTTLTVLTRPLALTLEDPSGFGPSVPYHLALYLFSTGAVLRWALDLLTELGGAVPDPVHLYRQLDAAAAALAPGAGGIVALPYFAGRPGAGAEGNWRGVLAGLTLEHGAAQLWRSLLEAPGYALLDRLQRPLPHPITRLVAAGGGARSAVWRSLLSDMLGRAQQTVEGSGALGAAFLAALGTGYATLGDLRTHWLAGGEVTRPNLAVTAEYRPLLERWQQLVARLSSP